MTLQRPLVFMFPEAIVFWSVFLWVFLPEIRLVRRATKSLPGEQDAGTARLIIVTDLVAQFAGFAASSLPWLVIPWPRIALYAGTGLLLAGSLLRKYCFRALGKYFTGAVAVSANQSVIDHGPYRWIRHPAYTGGFIMFLGVGVALGSWLSIAVLLLIPCYAYIRRVAAEERALLTTLGEPYRAYMARTKRFVPFVF